MSYIQHDEHEKVALAYDQLGQLMGIKQANGLSTRFEYNKRGQRSLHEVYKDGYSTTKVEYFYDAAGNLTERHDSRNGNDHYRYDLLGQVLKHTDPLGGLHEYVYDANGNRFSIDEHEDGRTVKHANGVVYQQDINGQARTRIDNKGKTQSYLWDSQSRLVEATTETTRTDYQYDPLGRRLHKQVKPKQGLPTDTWFLWDGDCLIGELTQTRNKQADDQIDYAKPENASAAYFNYWQNRFYHYYPGTFEPLVLYEYQCLPSGTELSYQTRYHYENDPNGMPLRLYNDKGDVVWTTHYSTWGLATYLPNLRINHIEQPLRLQGQYFDVETGLQYNRHRYYDAQCGVFICQDPIGLAGGENPYQFAPNTLGWVDPLGLAKTKCELRQNSAGDDVTRKYVKDQDELLAEAEKAAGGNLDNFVNYKENWYQSKDGKRRIEWNPYGHANTNEGPHVTVRDFDGKRHSVVEKIFISGRDEYDGKD